MGGRARRAAVHDELRPERWPLLWPGAGKNGWWAEMWPEGTRRRPIWYRCHARCGLVDGRRAHQPARHYFQDDTLARAFVAAFRVRPAHHRDRGGHLAISHKVFPIRRMGVFPRGGGGPPFPGRPRPA